MSLGAGAAWIAAAAVPVQARSWDGLGQGLTDTEVTAARRLYAAGQYGRLRQALPGLLSCAQETADSGPGAAGRAAAVWVLASQLAVKDADLPAAAAHAERAMTAARACGSPALFAAAVRAAATPLRRTGHTSQALHLLADAHHTLQATPRSPAVLNAHGMLALTAAYTAAAADQPTTAREFAALAAEHAAHLARLTDAWSAPVRSARLELSPAQVLLYRIGIERTLGDADRALACAERLNAAALPTAERRARAATDTARAYLAAGDVPAAFAQLQHLEQAAPQDARRPSVRALTTTVATRRPDLPGLTAFARRTGTTPKPA
ncbi:transcriptional regulator [Streptomyces sp. NPDC001941]|uniref:transcriptional regulator n=1 Tax=Streptomyces sp. NPDC001941 TaxID=3154659 RepID=UPI00333213BF